MGRCDEGEETSTACKETEVDSQLTRTNMFALANQEVRALHTVSHCKGDHMTLSTTPSLFQEGIRFQDGTLQTTGAVAIIQASQQGVNITEQTTVTAHSLSQVMYAVSLSMETTGTASAGHTMVATLAWTSPIEAHTQTCTLALDGGPLLIVETFPIFCLEGSDISISFVYGGGATNDPYTYSVRIVEMP